MSDLWTDRLSEYLDGELTAGERGRLEAHLADCADCAETLDQLRKVVARARVLEDRAPAKNLWPAIAARIGVAAAGSGTADIEAHRRRKGGRLREWRLSFSLPQLIAASISLMVLSSGAVWLALGPERPAAGIVSARPGAMTSAVPASRFAAAAKYDAAIAELERVLYESRGRLDTTTVRVIEENLTLIDRAIAQAQRALAEDPASAYLNEYLAETMRHKMEFLRQAATMAAAAS